MPHGTIPANQDLVMGDFATDEAWQPLTLLNGWTAYADSTFNSPQIYRDSTGMVHLRGLITHATGTGWDSGGVQIASMPYSSFNGFDFGVMWSGRVQNDATTNVVVSVSATTLRVAINRTGVQPACPWLSLDGICFPDQNMTVTANDEFYGKVGASATPGIRQHWTERLDLSSSIAANLNGPSAGGLSTVRLYQDGEGMCHAVIHVTCNANVQCAAQTIAVIPEEYRSLQGHYMAPITRQVSFDASNFGGETSRAEMNIQTGALTFVNARTMSVFSRWDCLLSWMPQNVIDNAGATATMPQGTQGSRMADVSHPNFYAYYFNPQPVVAPTYANTWTAYGTGYEGGQYIVSNNRRQRCRLHGLMRVGTAGTSAFTSLAPAKNHIFLGLNGTSNGSGNGCPAEFRVNTSGQVIPTQAALWHALSGASYRLI